MCLLTSLKKLDIVTNFTLDSTECRKVKEHCQWPNLLTVTCSNLDHRKLEIPTYNERQMLELQVVMIL